MVGVRAGVNMSSTGWRPLVLSTEYALNDLPSGR